MGGMPENMKGRLGVLLFLSLSLLSHSNFVHFNLSRTFFFSQFLQEKAPVPRRESIYLTLHYRNENDYTN
jgi:hypothetical protein